VCLVGLVIDLQWRWEIPNSLQVQKINRTTAPRMVVLRQDGSALKYCYRHADDELGADRHPMSRYEPTQIESEFRSRQRHFMSATSKQWTSSHDAQLAMSRAAEMRAGPRQGTDLVGQVKDVSFIEYVFGQIPLNPLVKH
jgi:hypothetical protein